ncbi:hypothetical protein [Paractinoplanes hotanensis]|uniref:DUF222 domain-containing protein n=1 Tax=Paractinoplanes hotanensis TaxID=2906497 RepID=A0ABT0YBD2_9ACTN|nr:hypothetical protein [Actinoplanes hotanensis]MCM4082787.1 hypothetical protein [Actinoplanes hotanensis]
MLEEVQVGEDVAKLAAASLWPLNDDDVIDTLRMAHRLEQAAAALQARLVQQAVVRKLPARHGHRNTTGWLRSHLLLDPGPARELTERAAVLARHPELEQALLDGRVDTRQAIVIAAASDTVKAELTELGESGPADDGRVTHEATTTLIELADRLPAYQLRRVGERILAHVAPQLAEGADEQALARQEARAHRARAFTLSTPVWPRTRSGSSRE